MAPDFLIIGGGIAGLSAAARLSTLGQTLVLEQEDSTGYHASGRSAALYEENYGTPSTTVLNRASAAYLRTALGGVLSARGVLLVGTDQTRAEFATDQKTLALNTLTIPEALALYPILNTDVVTQAAHDTRAKDIDTDLLMQSFIKTLRTNGGQVKTKHRVTKITKTRQGWQVQTASQTVTAKHLVNAAGPWADHIAQMAGITPIGLEPRRRSMARVPAPPGHDITHWPLVFGSGESWYAKPDAGALLVSPADATPTEPHDAYPDDLTLAQGLAQFEAHMHYTTPRLLASWAGLRTFSPDGSLVLGPDPADPTFIWCAGQGGYGIQSSPAASQLIADLASGRPSALDTATVAALSPARFAT